MSNGPPQQVKIYIMNIQNIASLEAQLLSLGFGNSGYSLIRRICFKPLKFSIPYKIEKGEDELSFQLFFEKKPEQNVYVLQYYDAILQKDILKTEMTIKGINSVTLEKQMAEIDWKNAFDLNTEKQWNIEDKTSWEAEQKVESVIEDLLALETVEEGKAIATNLKVSYWAGAHYQELVGNISPLKNKSAVSQRFYCSEDQKSISVDEAHRFLQNRLLEKQIQSKRKQIVEKPVEENLDNLAARTDNGISKKKRLGKKNSIKDSN